MALCQRGMGTTLHGLRNLSMENKLLLRMMLDFKISSAHVDYIIPDMNHQQIYFKVEANIVEKTMTNLCDMHTNMHFRLQTLQQPAAHCNNVKQFLHHVQPFQIMHGLGYYIHVHQYLEFIKTLLNVPHG